ncbi:ricin-type beta-trefoil lectin domain protein [Kitasatospora sp. NBC_00240]|uniref:ricin-type beta-trefoil lectin domain protein n=1 Tax=Kitasatospora sp. NBC_00240 TaxID=2903567 RepID=UPI00224F8347|nr:ricin-type beta-trefoil lectin domain protein [Kitasatospora sp. NBC_00240]MCX5208148.1 ricin-type beta-trefoil lectin domain protein [Kitasatospora sp. NBC_00240]
MPHAGRQPFAQVPRRTAGALAAAFALAIGPLAALSPQPAAAVDSAPAPTIVAADGHSPGRTFDGIGALSGGGGNTRLLTDYPAAQQQQILDYLFKPGYGANLQILKVEAGGDTNSTDGSESSHMRTPTTVNCNTGYEWWLMEQAKARNPAVKLAALSWGAPGWVGGGNFWTTDMIDYLTSWLGCARQHGLAVDYIGGWNENAYNVGWFKQLRTALDTAGYDKVQTVVSDDWGAGAWKVATDVAGDPGFAKAVSVISAHYPCEGGNGGTALNCPTDATARATGKAMWAGENGSQDLFSGAAPLIRTFTRGYVDGRLTAHLNWPAVAAVYPNQPYNTVGLVLANQPASGTYTVGKSAWATAQITQFVSPGWKFLDKGSGYLGGAESNGTYVTLKSPNDADYSTIIETTTATTARTVRIDVSNGLSSGPVHVWATDVNDSNSATSLSRQTDITPVNGSYALTVQPGHIYSLTTTTGQGKGTATGPKPGAVPLPYADDFDSTPIDQQPRYLAQQQGAFEATACAGGRTGRCLTQRAPAPPIPWDDRHDVDHPYTMGGDLGWTNYTVAADALLQQPGAVQLMARTGVQGWHPSLFDAYYLEVSDTGAWSIVRSSREDDGTAEDGNTTVLKSGQVPALGTGTWHHLALTADGPTLTAAVDNVTVGSATDTALTTGMVGLGGDGYRNDQFDNLSVTPVGPPAAATTGPVRNTNWGNEVVGCLDGNGPTGPEGTVVRTWGCDGSAAQRWTVGTDGTVRVNGKCLDVYRGGAADGSKVVLWDCHGGSNQEWIAQVGTLYNPVSGRCLHVPTSTKPGDADYAIPAGTQLTISHCERSDPRQRWSR